MRDMENDRGQTGASWVSCSILAMFSFCNDKNSFLFSADFFHGGLEAPVFSNCNISDSIKNVSTIQNSAYLQVLSYLAIYGKQCL